jgi:hypothetical protein
MFSLKLDIELILAIYSQPKKRKKKGWARQGVIDMMQLEEGEIK